MTIRTYMNIVAADNSDPGATARLDEMMWEARYAAGAACRKHPRAWIHFSSVNKLGINPKPNHRDPQGIYFYPTKWLLGDDASLSQFATEYEYYFVVDIDMTKGFVNLGNLRQEAAIKIARANGWEDDYRRLAADPKRLLDGGIKTEAKLLRKPGGLFYAVMDYLVNVEGKFRWLQLLRGVPGLVDPGYGIIATGEPAQAVVIDASRLTVLESGSNKDGINQHLATLMREIADEVGGTFSFKNRLPKIAVERDGRYAAVTIDLGRWNVTTSFSKEGHVISQSERTDLGKQTGDFDSYRQTIRYLLKKALEKADAVPVDHRYWDNETLERLLRLIRPAGRIHQRVQDGQVRLFSGDIAGSYEFGRAVEIVTQADDSVVVRAEIKPPWRRDDEARADWEAKVEATFKAGTRPEAAAARILQDLLRTVRPHLHGNFDNAKLGKILGFRFDVVPA